MEPVSSTRNQHVVRAGRLHRARDRREAGSTLVEGPHVLEEAIAGGASVSEVFGLPDDGRAQELATAAGARWIAVTDQVLSKLADTEHPRGPVAVVQIPPPGVHAGDRIWIDTSDPGNAGTLIRTAAAFEYAVTVAADAVDPWGPKVIRAAAGGHFRTVVDTGPPPDVFTIATVADGGVPLLALADHLPGEPVCILVGNEAHGLSAELRAGAGLTVSIPMPGGIESLNAAVSGALCMYELMRCRGSV